MERNNKIIAYYRIAEKENKYDKKKPDWINNVTCLKNFVKNFDGELTVFGDRLKETKKVIDELGLNYKEIKQHGNAQSFLEVFNLALELEPETIVYFAEDDYLHKPKFTKIIKEGLDKVDFVSLYDHPDKYQMNHHKLFYTESTHWQLIPTTTMTFASKVVTLRRNKEVFYKYLEGDHPQDFSLFSELTQIYKRTLASPVPSYATHGESDFLSPVVKWRKLVKL